MLSKSDLNGIKKRYISGSDHWIKYFDALGDPVRYKIFKILASNQNICVSELAKMFEISVPAASQQLKVLEQNGLIIRRRIGQSICCCVKKDEPAVKSIIKLITK